MHKSLSERYAKALFQAASEQNALDPVIADSEALLSLWEQSEELPRLLHRAEKLPEISDSISQDLKRLLNVSVITARLLDILVERKRISLLSDILLAFQQEIKSQKGIIQATVTSARSLDPDEIQRIQKQLNGVFKAQVDILWLQDHSILGGLHVQIGDRIFDGSLRNRMKQLHQHLTQG